MFSDAHSAESGEGKVIEHLMTDYQPQARPIKNPDLPVYINMTIALNQIVSLVKCPICVDC